jgi:putative copper resistance protein D
MDAIHLARTHRALHRFGTAGTAVVVTLFITGLINGWLILGPSGLVGIMSSFYGQILLAKLALFAAMLGLAALNRFRLTPSFAVSIGNGDHFAALAALRWSLAIETSWIVLVLGLVSWLGTLAPPGPAIS